MTTLVADRLELFPSATPSIPQHAASEAACERVMEVMLEHGGPLTVKRIADLLCTPIGEIHLLVDALCRECRVKRLNTVIESYTARFV